MPPMSRNTTQQPSISSPPPCTAKPSTPPRNNYADESTPIASAKRPGTKRRHFLPSEGTPAREEDLSPMHSAKAVPRGSHHHHSDGDGSSEEPDRDECSVQTEPGEDGSSWMGRRVDALFSPVLSFLNGGKDGELAAVDERHSDDEAVRSAVRSALLQASKELDEEPPIPEAGSDDSEHVPQLTGTDSSKDVDGDLPMDDRRKESHRHDNGGIDESANEPADDDACQHTDREDYDEDEFNPYLFIKSLPPYRHAIPPGWTDRSKSLPPPSPSDPPICLVLDLDETLVHCTVEPVRDADMVFPVEFNGAEYTVHVRCRPFLKEFLERVKDEFEVVVFTASQRVYADKLLDRIDPDGKYIRHRMFRDSCLPVEGNFLKDLTILGRDLRRAVLVDNSPHAFGYQVDNGIPIESWFDDPTDTELLKLERFLRTLHGKEDVREVVREKFQTFRLVLDA